VRFAGGRPAPDIDILVNNAGANFPAGDLQAIDEAPGWAATPGISRCSATSISAARSTPAMKARGRRRHRQRCWAARRGNGRTWGYIAGSAGNCLADGLSPAAWAATSLVDKIRIVACNPGLISTERMETMLRATAETKLGDGRALAGADP